MRLFRAADATRGALSRSAPRLSFGGPRCPGCTPRGDPRAIGDQRTLGRGLDPMAIRSGGARRTNPVSLFLGSGDDRRWRVRRGKVLIPLAITLIAL